MSDLQKALADAMKLARKKPGGLEEFLRELRVAMMNAQLHKEKK